MIGLKPCPFCGSEAELDARQPYRNISTGAMEDACAIYCTGCGAQHMACYRDFPDVSREHVIYDVTEAWNRRTPSTEAQPIGCAVEGELSRSARDESITQPKGEKL